MSQFIYVFDENGKDELEKLGLEIVREDTARGIYVFLNSITLNFSSIKSKFAFSDMLTF